MENKKYSNRYIQLVSLILLVLIIVPLCVSLNNADYGAYADASDNTVFFEYQNAEANSSGIIYVELSAEGIPGATVKVTYHTESISAIPGIDYENITNTVTLKIESNGKTIYKIALKCLNTAENREKLRLYSDKALGNVIFGRCFKVVIDEAENATIYNDKKECLCALTYNNKVSSTVGLSSTALSGGEVAYIDDYEDLQAYYHKGDKNIDGKERWRSWKNGKISFDNSTTQQWNNVYYQEGFADIYASYLIRVIDNSSVHSSTDIKVYAGNKEFISKYDDDSDTPGLYLYLSCEPHAIDDADRIDGRVMYIVTTGKNPYKEDSDYVDVTSYKIKSQYKRFYWIQGSDAWYASKGALYNSIFYKINPYNGVFDAGVSVYNKNKEVDIEAKDIWAFMTMIDDKCPTIVGQYVDDSMLTTTKKLRLYIRFSEPVYTSKKGTLDVKINSSSLSQQAVYVAGNYSDTLVYEIDAPRTNITSISYQLPTNDIGDMSYNLDAYKNIYNNKVQNTDQTRSFDFINGPINNIPPQVSADITSSTAPKNIYNLLLSIDGSGNLKDGTIYYEWSKSSEKPSKDQPSAYANSYVLREEDTGSLNISLVKNEAEGIDSGSYYLHALGVSTYGLQSQNTFGPYYLDGDPPSITLHMPEPNDLQQKVFNLDVNSTFSANDTKELILVAKWRDANKELHTDQRTLVTNGEIPASLRSVVKLIDNGTYITYQYKSNIDASDTTIPLDDFIQGLMGEEVRLYFDISFMLIDNAGNSITSSVDRVVYDKRASFVVNTTIVGEEIEAIPTAYSAYDISTGKPQFSITIDLANPGEDLTENTKFSVLVNGEDSYEAPSTDVDTVVITLDEVGFYELVPRITGNDSESPINIVSKSIRFYLTDGKNDRTTNYDKIKNNLVLSNKVYQLQDVKYYYLNEDGTAVKSFTYGSTYNDVTDKYDGGSPNPTFSSSIESKKYVKFMEYQDMQLVALTANMANLLNSNTGSTIYSKAANETMVAQEGQLWIRYKRATWTTSSSSFGWAFYYYGSGIASEGININGLSNNLNDAINKIVNKITSEGKEVFLVEEDQLNAKTGAPYLADNQVHVTYEEATTSLSGSNYLVKPTYNGDASLYQNQIAINDTSYALATNLVFDIDENTYVYYKYYEASQWEQLDIQVGKTLSDMFGPKASGIYYLREYGTQGVCEYSIYFDKTTPTLTINLNGEDIILDGTIERWSGKDVIIKSLNSEIDPYGYVAIYTYPTKVLKQVLYKDDITGNDGYELSSANYYIQVGDRSGNLAMYTFILSASALEVTATENSTNSGIYVKVLNRSESEIFSYEVYLNEVLISSEFAESKLYKDPGIYRIVVSDIYGNEVTTTKEFEFASPEITWYYLNSSGSYSKYDSSKPVNMIIRDDTTSSRISNVYTSTLIRMMFNTNYGDSDIRFDILDIGPTDYTYSETTGVISINTLTSWRMRTWYAAYPENDHTYICKIDTESPDFKATFVGTSYGVYVEYDSEGKVIKTSSVDNLDLEDKQEGDILTVDTLAYAIGSTTTIPFFSGNVINGNHIIIELSDPSDIKSYSVKRNGQVVTAVLNIDGQLILNGYGNYVITAIDSLGNSGTFTFVNTKDTISGAQIDDKALTDSELEYGNSEVVIGTKYAGRTTFLVDDGVEKSTYVFEFDGNTLTYGRYICAIELVEGEGDLLVEQKVGDYVQATGFYLSLSDDNIKKERWYSVITTDNYKISAMFNDDSCACYKIECVETLIQVEASFYVGNNVFPSYYKADLSKVNPTVTLLTGGEEVEIVPGSPYIYIAKELTIDPDNISEDITKIEVSYAKLPNFTSFETIYEDGAFKAEFVGEEYGFYAILVTNKYNTQTQYIVSKIDSFISQVRVTYQDGETRNFDTNPSVIYSNAMIELIVYSENVQFEVNGETYSGILRDGTIVLELAKYGLYSVRVVAANGIAENFYFNIGTNPNFVFDEAWISGYNEEALFYSQGYTNTLLTIEPVMGVEYVDYIYNDGLPHVLYDNISEDPINNPDAFINAIGNDGPGRYVVRFRNLNGDLASKTIHYNNIPALQLTRKTVANPNTYEEYKISDATRINFYSNYVLRFATSSMSYDFKVNGNIVSLEQPYVVEFNASSGNGSFEYLIDYLDEYGNKISFKAILYRADVEISTNQMKTIDINGNLYTKDNVVITFKEGLKATVKVNDKEAVSYNSGDIFYKDGVYVFTIRDIAGNINVYTITHKSVNAYQMIDSTTSQPIIQGGVINNTSVVFNATDDSRVKSIFKNGEKVESLDVRTFATTGHWEVVVEDLVGNQSYSEFYVINNSLCSFVYDAPYDYVISEVWYTNKQGQRTQIETTGDHIELTENGDYAVIVLGKEFTSSFQFSVEIDNTPPKATLDGVEDGGVTARDVTVKGLRVGDIVEVYKNGTLLEKFEVSLSSDTPEITTGGDYRIVITNIQGAKIEYNFTRKSIANTAASIFIIILCLAAVIGVAIGLVYHTGLKTDS